MPWNAGNALDFGETLSRHPLPLRDGAAGKLQLTSEPGDQPPLRSYELHSVIAVHAKKLSDAERGGQGESLSAAERALSLPHRMSLSDLIRSKRKLRGLTQVGLAELLNVNKSAVAQWELDQTAPSVDKMSRLRDVLGIDRAAEATSGFPNGYQFVEEPEKLALLKLFDLMDHDERMIVLRMIQGAVSQKRAP